MGSRRTPIPRHVAARLALAAVLATLTVCARAALPPSLDRILTESPARHDALSLLIEDLSEGGVVASHLPDVARNPASAIKLLTTLAALELLGPSFVWHTDVLAGERPRHGRLRSPLYLKGTGDPFLVVERFWKLVQDLRARGLRDLAGGLVLDDAHFEVAPHDPGAFDGKPYRPYNVAPGALLVNFSATTLSLVPGDGRARVVLDPPNQRIVVDDRVRLVGGACPRRLIRFDVSVEADRTSVVLRGRLPTGCHHEWTVTRAFQPRRQHLQGVFEALWRASGGTLAGPVRFGSTPKEARRLHRTTSPPLGDLIRGINKFSNNVMSRNLLLTLGAEALGVPGTVEKGREAITAWLAAAGLELPDLVLVNGAGLSRDARVTARGMSTLLRRAWASPLVHEFVSSLPLAAHDGSLRERFSDGYLAGRAHIKTGLLDHVRSLAGYVVAGDGRTYSIVMLHNQTGIHHGSGTHLQNRVLEWLFDR